jgi:hypothetical protein
MDRPAIVIRDIHRYGDDLTLPQAIARLCAGGPVTTTVTDPAPPGGDPRGTPRHGTGITITPAEDIIDAALADAEDSARSFQVRVLGPQIHDRFRADPGAAARELGTSPARLGQALAGTLDALAASCLDIDHSPFSSGRCTASFLMCLHCPNALVLERHLPMLYALLDRPQDALGQMTVPDWCRVHGVTWLIITRLILPGFSPAQREACCPAPGSRRDRWAGRRPAGPAPGRSLCAGQPAAAPWRAAGRHLAVRRRCLGPDPGAAAAAQELADPQLPLLACPVPPGRQGPVLRAARP